jgi:hypothetical protein
MRKKLRMSGEVRRMGGVLVALVGLLLVARVMPGWFWIFALGLLFIWAGWALYSEK